MLKNIAIWVSILFFSVGYVIAQDSLSIIGAKIAHQTNSGFKEKLFVHTDQDFYLAGEIIWFKIYLTDASTHKPTDLSSVTYLEIVDAEQNPVLQAKVALEKGVGKGSLFLPFSLSSGNFKMRAYTAWMKNFNSEFNFEKIIKVINPLKVAEVKSTIKEQNFDIQFFPEGGNLVAGADCKVAFKAVDKYGKGVNFTGKLVNKLNQEITVFAPLKFGMGYFEFKPEKNMQYKAIVNYNNSEVVKDLMNTSANAYAMRLNEIGSDSIELTIVNAVDKDLPVYLLLHQEEKTTIAQKVDMKNGIAKFYVDKNKVAEGISCFTVFNSKMQPVCERLYFKRPTKSLQLTVKSNEAKYQSREKVALQIQAKDETSNSISADLSIAVFKKEDTQTFTEANIFSYLWLKSDIKGAIENINYYFENDDDETNQALDNLLLTQGWRKFKPENELNKEQLLKFTPEYQQNIIRGKVVYKNGGKPAPDVLALLSVLDNTAHLYGAKSDAEGNLAFYTRNITGPVQLALQTNTLEDSLYKIALDDPFINQQLHGKLHPLQISKYDNKSILDRSLYMQVQNIYYANELKNFTRPYSKNFAFYGNTSDKTYKLDQYVRFPAMEEVLREYVPEVGVKSKDNNFTLTTYNVQDKIYMYSPPLILLDGVPVKDVNRLIRYNPLKIKELDIVAKQYYLGPLTFGGILNFSSIRGGYKDFDLDPNVMLVDYDGLQIQREFYTPKYENLKDKASRLPDFRTLLYWNADVRTVAKEVNELDFYTSDLKGNYIIVLQGLSNSGRVGYSTSSFEVE